MRGNGSDLSFFDIEYVRLTISQLKKNKATRADLLPNKLLKHNASN